MALCEVALSDGSDLAAEGMKFGLGWNSKSVTLANRKNKKAKNVHRPSN